MGPYFTKPQGHIVWVWFAVPVEKGSDITEEIARDAVKEAWNSLPMVQQEVNDSLEVVAKEANIRARRRATDIQFAKETR